MRVFVERGAKRTFAGAIDWPGWARGAKDEQQALETLVAYGARYRSSLGEAAAEFDLPVGTTGLEMIAELLGGSGTDFGVPSAVADFDRLPLAQPELGRLVGLLQAAWYAVDVAAASAAGRPLATGPRGGGRSLEQILDHVAEADRAYVASLGAKPPSRSTWPELQAAFVEAIGAKLRGELPEFGPRGGERWPARYAIRRSAWHALDHAWEIEDRL